MAQIGTDIGHAVSLLESGELVGIPTETVYGLAGNALNEEAILKIYEVKDRPKFDPLIAHTNSIEKVKKLVTSIPDKAQTLANELWPGPLTLLLEKSGGIPDLLTSGLSRIAVRIPNHDLSLELLANLDFPLAAPSANPFGYVSPTEAQHVEDHLGMKISYILDGGPCKVGLESTIVGFEGDRATVHRLGGKRIEEIEELIGEVQVEINQSSNPLAPGMLKSHYSPGKKLLLGDIDENLEKVGIERVGVISFAKQYDVAKENQVDLSPNGDFGEAARNIFKTLRYFDRDDIDIILAELLPEEGLGRAINDRLRRAASE